MFHLLLFGDVHRNPSEIDESVQYFIVHLALQSIYLREIINEVKTALGWMLPSDVTLVSVRQFYTLKLQEACICIPYYNCLYSN